MKLRYVVLVTLVAASLSACADSPTASKPARTSTGILLTEGDTATRGGGTYGSGH
jgi:type IV pilus biogenesis protein CpaD/CtpE